MVAVYVYYLLVSIWAPSSCSYSSSRRFVRCASPGSLVGFWQCSSAEISFVLTIRSACNAGRFSQNSREYLGCRLSGELNSSAKRRFAFNPSRQRQHRIHKSVYPSMVNKQPYGTIGVTLKSRLKAQSETYNT